MTCQHLGALLMRLVPRILYATHCEHTDKYNAFFYGAANVNSGACTTWFYTSGKSSLNASYVAQKQHNKSDQMMTMIVLSASMHAKLSTKLALNMSKYKTTLSFERKKKKEIKAICMTIHRKKCRFSLNKYTYNTITHIQTYIYLGTLIFCLTEKWL